MMKYLLNIALFVMTCSLEAKNHFAHPLEALKLAAKYLPKNPVIIDAGAYIGLESVAMAEFFPEATIHSFEPIPYLYDQLKNNASKYPTRIFTYPLAVGDRVGTADMYVSEQTDDPGIPTQSSSLLAPKEHLTYSPATVFNQKITVPVTTFDAWMEAYGIDHVDLLWLDMQGAELQALMASPKMLKNVKVILTEVEYVEAYEGQYLYKDVKRWLEKQGFIMIADNYGAFGWFGDVLFVRMNN